MTDETKKQKPATSDDSIKVGDISNATGVAIGHGAKAVVTQSTGVTGDEIVKIFAALTQKVEALPDGPQKSVAQSAVKALETEAGKGDRADEGTISKWVNFLAQTAPDVWEVAVDTFLNPIKGLSTAFKKIAERAKAERQPGQ